ncbi:hypothetical protein PP187_gp297 [Klebsiella phage vB_KvM-Eowyn]|uniref:Uncharacterized protein n=1 Tax=Klebsiella phage vB_KvM-Eowyn TaxID=2762819 RepID=A0A7R8MJU3_9CAUD|nr:hypothetical protein PP187_gp297 [Klebsiella phage vB_KvM-Eowyn]CAD5236286.1 hypothetical protein LLCLJKAH_00297 [Klebsiella phage vB_KvM-Eowyn]
MDAITELKIEYFFMGLVKEYRRTFKPCSDPSWRQISVWQYAPHLKPSRAWERSLAEMNGVCWNDPWHTGVCLPIALFAKAWFKDVLGLSAELCAIKTRMDLCGIILPNMPWSFLHAVIKCNGRFYDTFIPRGTTSFKKVYGGNVAHQGMSSKIVPHSHAEFNVGQMKSIFQDFILPMKQKMYPENTAGAEFQSIFKELL